jgi:uncharacterized protein DUF402
MSHVPPGPSSRRSSPTRKFIVPLDSAPVSSWQPGETVVLRYFNRGRPTGALPTRAVSNGGDPVLWLAAGTTVQWPGVGGRHVRDVPLRERYTQPVGTIARQWSGDGVLILGRPDRPHAIWLFRENGRFAGWYVNLEAPWRPFRFGFDTEDHALDIWIESDGSWRWKDEHELAVAVDVGFFSSEQAAAFRAEGERVLAEWPFPTGWEDWRADPSWPIPTLPAGWEA